MKALLEARSDRNLDFTMLGADAGEIMTVIQTAMLTACPTPVCATRSSRTRPLRRDSPRSSRRSQLNKAEVKRCETFSLS
jgi:hypothetical protein